MATLQEEIPPLPRGMRCLLSVTQSQWKDADKLQSVIQDLHQDLLSEGGPAENIPNHHDSNPEPLGNLESLNGTSSCPDTGLWLPGNQNSGRSSSPTSHPGSGTSPKSPRDTQNNSPAEGGAKFGAALTLLRQQLVDLRRADTTLFSQLLSLNDNIQKYKQRLADELYYGTPSEYSTYSFDPYSVTLGEYGDADDVIVGTPRCSHSFSYGQSADRHYLSSRIYENNESRRYKSKSGDPCVTGSHHRHSGQCKNMNSLRLESPSPRPPGDGDGHITTKHPPKRRLEMKPSPASDVAIMGYNDNDEEEDVFVKPLSGRAQPREPLYENVYLSNLNNNVSKILPNEGMENMYEEIEEEEDYLEPVCNRKPSLSGHQGNRNVISTAAFTSTTSSTVDWVKKYQIPVCAKHTSTVKLQISSPASTLEKMGSVTKAHTCVATTTGSVGRRTRQAMVTAAVPAPVSACVATTTGSVARRTRQAMVTAAVPAPVSVGKDTTGYKVPRSLGGSDEASRRNSTSSSSSSSSRAKQQQQQPRAPASSTSSSASSRSSRSSRNSSSNSPVTSTPVPSKSRYSWYGSPTHFESSC